ncbi:MAG TPA: hypothetical protein VF175_19690 [Lacipirellula sp.]
MRDDDFLNADYNDPFQPPAGVRPVRCLHCGEVYPSSEIRWSRRADLWVCKNYDKCGGAGYGMDIHDAERRSDAEAIEDFFGEEKVVNVFCSQCGETYPVDEMHWDPDLEAPRCKNAPKCQGKGFGDLCDGSSPYVGGEVE